MSISTIAQSLNNSFDMSAIFGSASTKSAKSDSESSFSATSVSSTDQEIKTASTEGAGQVSLSDDLSQALFESRVQEASSMVESMDTDGDGQITEEEFTAARPDDVSEEMSVQLWSELSGDAESVGADDLSQAMAEMAPPPPPPPLPPPSGGSEATSSSQEDGGTAIVTSSLDTNGDGEVSLEELLAASSEEETTTSSVLGEAEETDIFSSIRSQFLEMIDSYQASAGISSANLQQQLMSDLSI